MANATTTLMAGMLVAGMVAAARPAVAGDVPSLSMPRVRSNNATLVTLIAQATDRSQTFRLIIDTINASDGIVYVEAGECGHGVRACFVGVSAAGPNRILRIKVDTRKADWDLMGSIGHELRHAMEVLENPTVTSNAAMFMFYHRVGSRRSGGAFETDAAVNAGNTVRAEARKALALAERN